MSVSPKLRDAYRSLLRERGLTLGEPIVFQEAVNGILFLAGEAYKNSGWSGDFASFISSPESAFNQEVVREFISHVTESGLNHQFYLDTVKQVIEEAVARAGYQLSSEVFVGEFPTRSFNAQVTLCDPGFLILLNSGLYSFVHLAMKVLSLSVEFAEFDAQGKHIPSTRFGKSPFAKAEEQEALLEIILAYLMYKEPFKATRLPVQHSYKTKIAADLVAACVNFAIAHEYGHIIDGHLASSSIKSTDTASGPLEVITKNYQQEFEADGIGARLILLSAGHFENNTLVFGIDSQHWLAISIALAGPLLFLGLDQLVTRVASEIFEKEELMLCGDHPPAAFRVKMVRRIYDNFGFTELPRFTDFCVDWLQSKEENVLELVSDNLDSIRRRFEL